MSAATGKLVSRKCEVCEASFTPRSRGKAGLKVRTCSLACMKRLNYSPAAPESKKRLSAGQQHGLEALRQQARKVNVLGVGAPFRYRKALSDKVREQGEDRVRADTGFTFTTIYRIIAGAGIARGTLARLMMLFDGADAAAKFLASAVRPDGNMLAYEDIDE